MHARMVGGCTLKVASQHQKNTCSILVQQQSLIISTALLLLIDAQQWLSIWETTPCITEYVEKFDKGLSGVIVWHALFPSHYHYVPKIST